MSRGRTVRAYAAGLAAVLLLAGCLGDDSTRAPTPAATSAPATTAPEAAATPSPSSATASQTPWTLTPTTPTPTTATPTHRATPRPAPGPATCRVPAGVRAAQVVLVDSAGSRATIRACHRSGSRYLLDHGPYAGHVGRNGVSYTKREGDLRTPAGTFPLRGGFGVYGNPGLRLGWFVTDADDVWVDDPHSSLYNTHQRRPVGGRWSSAENLLSRPAYNYAQVIGYNEARTPGRGSAIFLHVDLGGGTAGCVSLSTGAIRTVLRWEKPGAVITIR